MEKTTNKESQHFLIDSFSKASLLIHHQLFSVVIRLVFVESQEYYITYKTNIQSWLSVAHFLSIKTIYLGNFERQIFALLVEKFWHLHVLDYFHFLLTTLLLQDIKEKQKLTKIHVRKKTCNFVLFCIKIKFKKKTTYYYFSQT